MNAKGDLITKYYFVPILTCPIQMLFAQAILAFLCFSVVFSFFLTLLPLNPFFGSLFQIVKDEAFALL